MRETLSAIPACDVAICDLLVRRAREWKMEVTDNLAVSPWVSHAVSQVYVGSRSRSYDGVAKAIIFLMLLSSSLLALCLLGARC